MKGKGLFSFKKVGEIQKKGYSPYMAFANYLAFNGWNNLAAFQTIYYWKQVAPLNDAIMTIADECEAAQRFIFDNTSEKYINRHPLLDLLKHPNSDMLGDEFFEALIAYFKITGNAFIIARGPIGRPPLELDIAPPQYVTVSGGSDGYIESIYYTPINASTARKFVKKEIDGRFRYYSEGAGGELDAEIWLIRSFNPDYALSNGLGLSRLTCLYYEIEQHIKIAVHNLGILTNGTRPSGIIAPKEGALDQENYDRLAEEAARFYQGAENAGKVLVMNDAIEFKPLSVENKDMDFEKLQMRLRTQIYQNQKIPLPLIDAGAMNYSNYATAKEALYDMAVLPLLRRIFNELTAFLMPRYEKRDPLRYNLAYNIETMPALATRRLDEAKKKSELKITTVNELRNELGYESATGGDDIYAPSGSIPIARINDQQEEEELDESLVEAEKQMLRDHLLWMKKARDQFGRPLYGQKEIELKQLQLKASIYAERD